MRLALGIDTGGTYTDGVLIEHETGYIVHSAKVYTTHGDLSEGITEVVENLFRACAHQARDVALVGLSTTLATNAVIEGRGADVCLVLIGYDRKLIDDFGLNKDLVTRDVVFIDGGHDCDGNQVRPLDEETLKTVVQSRKNLPVSFAVSGYFGVRNPAHEIRARQLISSLTDGTVTCGHELTPDLDSIRRATTVALNAKLVPLLQGLIRSVRQTLEKCGISGPLMVVRGDGSLVLAGWAMERPIETVLSGPAASVIGARQLIETSGRGKPSALWVMDMGGTTTDICALNDGRPRLSPKGARIGRWRTMVEAADIYTLGLGGDSHVRIGKSDELVIGPKRVIPLCRLAQIYPAVKTELQRQSMAAPSRRVACLFLSAGGLSDLPLMKWEQNLVRRVSSSPVSLDILEQEALEHSTSLGSIERLEAVRFINRAGFTPTDALHVLGLVNLGDAEASGLGAMAMARILGVPPEDFCRKVFDAVSNRAAKALISKVLTDESPTRDQEEEILNPGLMQIALGERPVEGIDCRLILNRPLVGVGAPASAFIPKVSEQLNTEYFRFPHAEVANAVGAVAGGIILHWTVVIGPLPGQERVRVHLPDGFQDFEDLECAVAFAKQKISDWLTDRARKAGATAVQLDMLRRDLRPPAGPYGGEQTIYLGTELLFTVTGRPGFAGQPSDTLPDKSATP